MTGAAPFMKILVTLVISIQSVCVITKASTFTTLTTSAIQLNHSNVVLMCVMNSNTEKTQAKHGHLYLGRVTFVALNSMSCKSVT